MSVFFENIRILDNNPAEAGCFLKFSLACESFLTLSDGQVRRIVEIKGNELLVDRELSDNPASNTTLKVALYALSLGVLPILAYAVVQIAKRLYSIKLIERQEPSSIQLRGAISSQPPEELYTQRSRLAIQAATRRAQIQELEDEVEEMDSRIFDQVKASIDSNLENLIPDNPAVTEQAIENLLTDINQQHQSRNFIWDRGEPTMATWFPKENPEAYSEFVKALPNDHKKALIAIKACLELDTLKNQFPTWLRSFDESQKTRRTIELKNYIRSNFVSRQRPDKLAYQMHDNRAEFLALYDSYLRAKIDGLPK